MEVAVGDAERRTGLQIAVYLGAVGDDARADAERLFVESGSHTRPAVLVLVAPSARRVEIVTAPTVRERLTDEACTRVVERMLEYFRRGEIATGIVRGLEQLTQAAGPGRGLPGEENLPDVIGTDDTEGTDSR